MRVFITGATGFVGRNFLEWLLRHHPELSITCLVRDIAKAEAQWPAMPPNVTWLCGDLLRPETYQAAIQQAALVVHTAALVSLRNGPEFYTQNTEATRQLLTALQGNPHLTRLVFVGSISAVDRPWELPATRPLTEEDVPCPRTDYGRSKLEAETLVMASGLPYSVLIPAYIYGPHPRPNSSMDRLVQDLRAEKPYTRFPFPGFASAVHVADLAEMLWIAATHPNTLNERFFVSALEPVSVFAAYAQVAEALGQPLTPLPMTPTKLRRYQSRWRAAHPESLVLRILFEHYFACSVAKWVKTTGHQPRYSLKEGIAQTLAWYRERGTIS